MIKNNFNLNRGFTLIETLVSVAILMVAIAGPLTIANQALTAALGSRNAMIATYLALDGMESIKNIKDNNLSLTPFNWDNVVTGSCTSLTPCSTPHPFTFITSDPSKNTLCTNILPSGNCQLYTNDSKDIYFYGGDVGSGDRLTPFTRYYYVKDVTSPANPNEKIITVVVAWNDGSVPNAITLQELMTNIVR